MILTGRLNSLSLGINAVRDLTMGNKSSFKREKAGRALGQHQPGHALGLGQCPVNGRWARGLVRHEEDLLKPQLGDDGIHVTDLIGGSIGIAGWLIRTAPPKKIK